MRLSIFNVTTGSAELRNSGMPDEGILKAKMADDVVLSYFDSLLRQSDVQLLQQGRWLNDNIIAFIMEYFEQVEFNDPAIAFVSPSLSQLLKLCDDCSCFLEPLELKSKQLVFLVVNDSDSKTSSGGSHWSLLVYRRSSNCFSHFDSWHGHNNRSAQDLTNQIKSFVNANHSPEYQEEQCPQQTNGCDCGMYVVCTMRYLSQQYLGRTAESLPSTVNASTVTDMRRHISDLIKQLATSTSH